MNMIDRLFALRGSQPFAELRDAELVLIASAARPKTYQPGEIIGLAGRPLRHLYVVVHGGAVTAAGVELPKAFGAVSLLFGAPLEEPVRAGPEGATCLLVRRAHFHTILNECPGFVVGLLRGDRGGEPARAA
jgi:signal-transduction protein with cAMP-binding, CBS, and nucleotidyltransferase domain